MSQAPVDPRIKARKSLSRAVRHAKSDESSQAVAAGLRALSWAVLYVGDQLKRQADFWDRGS